MAEERKQNWFKRHKILSTLLALFIIFLIIGATGQDSKNKNSQGTGSTTKPTAQPSTPPAKAQYGAKITDYMPVNPADLKVYAEVTNTGNGAGKPECTIKARDDSYTYSGFDIVDYNTDLRPSGIWSFAGDLTITKQGANYVTQVTIDCK